MAESAITVIRQNNLTLYLCKKWHELIGSIKHELTKSVGTFPTHELNSWSVMEFLDSNLTKSQFFCSMLFTVPFTGRF
jgi:hypothetical protein